MKYSYLLLLLLFFAAVFTAGAEGEDLKSSGNAFVTTCSALERYESAANPSAKDMTASGICVGYVI
jgi:hypothetical protein